MATFSWIWLGIMVACLVTEALTMSLTTIWFAIGALVMIFVSLLPLHIGWQFLIFAVLSLVLMVFTRPFALRVLKLRKTATNSDSLIGKEYILIEDIEPGQKGAVKINGVVWSARAEDTTAKIEKDAKCVVVRIDGATLIVRKSI